MVEEDLSDSETDAETNENRENLRTEEFQNRSNGEQGGLSEYEKQRLLRIKENRARMEAFGLPYLASSLSTSVEKQPKLKGKGKKEQDGDYKPSDGDEGLSSSSDEEKEEEDLDVGVDGSSGSRRASGKNKKSLNTGKAKKKVSLQKLLNESDFIDDDDALRQAIALSLQESAIFPDVVHSVSSLGSGAPVADNAGNGGKRRDCIQEDMRRKRRKSSTSRVQMTEDEVILHFFQFDVAGKGNITVRDLQRVATAHDFSWTDKEIVDMIHSFDSDGDGKLSLEDFRNIVCRCRMIQGNEAAVTGSKS